MKKHVQKFDEHQEVPDNTWNNAFDCVIKGLKESPIVYKDSHNNKGPIFLQDILDTYATSGEFPDFEKETFISELVDVVAYFIDKNGYTITKK